MDFWLKIFLGVFAVIILVTGLSISLFGAGVFLGIAGGGMFSSGLYGFAAVFRKDATPKRFFIAMGKGLLIGIVSGWCSVGAASIIVKLSGLLGPLNRHMVAAILGSVVGLVTNGFVNILSGNNFFDGWFSSMVMGAIVGVVCYSLSTITWSDEAHETIRKLREGITKHIPAGCPDWIKRILTIAPVIRESSDRLMSLYSSTQSLLGRRDLDVTKSKRWSIVRKVLNWTWTPPKISENDDTEGDSDVDIGSGDKGDDEEPGLTKTMEAIGQLTKEEFDELMSQMRESFSKVEELGETKEQRQEELSSCKDEQNSEEKQMGGEEPILEETSTFCEDFGTLKKAIPSETMTPNHALAILQPAQNDVHNLHGGHHHLNSAEMKLKCRATATNFSNSSINDEGSLFDCFERHNKLAMERQVEHSTASEIKETVNVNYETQRLSVRVSEGQRSSNSSTSVSTYHANTEFKNEGLNIDTSTLGASESIQSKIHLPDDVTQAVAFKIAYHCDKKNEYVITETWPEFDYSVRVLGVHGIKNSGITYCIMRIITSLGYSMKESDIALCRLPIGITGYLLQKHRILIIECCDGLDFGVPNDENSNFNTGGAFMELLTFSISDRVLFSFPFNTSPASAAKHLISHFDLLINMSCLYTFPTKKDIRVLLRTGKEDSQSVKEMSEQLRLLLNKKAEDVETTADGDLSETENDRLLPVEEAETNKNMVLSDELLNQLKFIRASCSLDARILKYHELSGVPISYGQDNILEMQDLLRFVERDDTPRMDAWSVRHTTTELFQLMKKKGMAEKLTQFQNRNTQEHDKSHVSEALESYLQKVSCFHKSLLNGGGVYKKFEKELSKYFKEFKSKIKNAKNIPEENRTGIMYHMITKHVIDIGDKLTSFCSVNNSNAKLCSEGILLGLQGYLLFPSMEVETTLMKQVPLRMALEAGLMEHLKKKIVNKNFKESWTLLTLLARYGFRLKLMEFDFWSTMQEFFMVKNPELSHDRLIIYREILKFLKELSNGTATSFLPKKINFWQERENCISHQSIAQIGFDFESEVRTEIDDVCEKVLIDNRNCAEEHDRFINRPKAWIEQSTYGEKYKNATKYQQDYLLQMLIHRSFELLHKSFAFHISKKIMPILPEIASCTYENQSVGKDIMKHRLAIAANIAVSVKGDPILVAELLRSDSVLGWLTKLVKRNKVPPNFPQILNACTSLIACEKNTKGIAYEKIVPRLKHSASGQFVAHDEFLQKSKFIQIIQDKTFTRHKLLKAGIVKILLDHFLRRAVAPLFDHYVMALSIFLLRGHGLEPLSSDLFIGFRQEICAKVLGHIRDLTQHLKDNNVNEEGKTVIVTKVTTSVQFLNKLIRIFYDGEYKGEFFPKHSNSIESQLGNKNWHELVTALEEIYTLQQFRNDQNPEMVKYVLHLMLNMASLTGKSVGQALSERGEAINDQRETIPIKKIFYGNVELDIDTKNEKDDAFIAVAAHIIAGDKHMFSETRSILRRMKKLLRCKTYTRSTTLRGIEGKVGRRAKRSKGEGSCC